MSEPVYGLTAESAKTLQDMANRHRQRLPDVGRRVRRIGPPGKSSLNVLGPCATYTPDVGLPDTDFAYAYPDGCVGPNRIGINIENIDTGAITVVSLEWESDSPLTLSSDNFTFACVSGTLTAYAKIVFTSTQIDDVDLTIYKTSDDSVVTTYRNAISSYYPLAPGKLQLGPGAVPCTCGSLPYDLCLSLPNR